MDQSTQGAGRTMGDGGSEWRQLVQAVWVLERHDRIVSTESVADQRREPAHATAMQAVELATVASTPLASLVAKIDDDARVALLSEVRTRLQPYVESSGLAFPIQTHIVTAHR